MRKPRDPAVYEAVRDRAEGLCEACGERAAQFDHFFGRARAHAVETVWILCRVCHREKTDNKPSARWWLEVFIAFCERHGYAEAAERARRRLDGIVKMRGVRK